MDFFIGDRVRLLYSRAEGVITRMLPDGLAEIDIDNDFPTPVPLAELVPISRDENVFLGKTEKTTIKVHDRAPTPTTPPTTTGARSVQGLYLAAVPCDNQRLEFYLMNNADIGFLYGFFTRSAADVQKNIMKGVIAGLLQPKSVIKISEERLQTIDAWQGYLFEITPFLEGYGIKQPAFQRRFLFKKTDFESKLVEVRPLKAQAYLFQLDEPEKINAELLRTQMLTPKINADTSLNNKIINQNVPKKLISSEVDLHIEVIHKDTHATMNKTEMLQAQLSYFEKVIDEALVNQQMSVVLIHGIGNGVLKNEIQSRARQHPRIDTYKDARKEKFGYGATEIFFK
jgi:DNA-nicking Smr family endonuclease